VGNFSKLTVIEYGTFQKCRALTSVIIGNSVEAIKSSAFEGCSSLSSITLPPSVKTIHSYAFKGIDFRAIYSLIDNPFEISNEVFSTNTYKSGLLYVPSGTIGKYKELGGWSNFVSINEYNPLPCEKPTISYENGKLKFNCSTDNVTLHSTISDEDITSYTGNEINLGLTYVVCVYASKEGYKNSEVATAILCWIDQEPKTEGTINGVAQIEASPVLIQNRGEQIIISGVKDGTKISAYTISEKQIVSTDSFNGQAKIDANLSAGNVVIVKIGNKFIKVLLSN
jgi:hypothetical protein